MGIQKTLEAQGGDDGLAVPWHESRMRGCLLQHKGRKLRTRKIVVYCLHSAQPALPKVTQAASLAEFLKLNQ